MKCRRQGIGFSTEIETETGNIETDPVKGRQGIGFSTEIETKLSVERICTVSPSPGDWLLDRD